MLVVFSESHQITDEFSWLVPLFWVRKIINSKCGLPTTPIGILGAITGTLCTGAKPPNCRTCEFKRIVVIAENSAHSFRRKLFGFLFPTTWSIVVRNKPCLRSVAPKLWWWRKITVSRIILRALQNSWKTSPLNLTSFSATMIPGAPNASDPFAIALPRTISEVCSSFVVPISTITEKRVKLPRMRRKVAKSPYPTESIAPDPSRVFAIGIFATSQTFVPVWNRPFYHFPK